MSLWIVEECVVVLGGDPSFPFRVSYGVMFYRWKVVGVTGVVLVAALHIRLLIGQAVGRDGKATSEEGKWGPRNVGARTAPSPLCIVTSFV